MTTWQKIISSFFCHLNYRYYFLLIIFSCLTYWCLPGSHLVCCFSVWKYLLSSSCCNKLPQSGRLNKTEMCSVTVLEAIRLKSRWWQDCSVSRDGRCLQRRKENGLLAFPYFWQLPGILVGLWLYHSRLPLWLYCLLLLCECLKTPSASL